MSDKFQIIPIGVRDEDRDDSPKVESPLPQPPFMMAAIGPPGSGKTVAVLNLALRFLKGYFHNFFVISGSIDADPAYAMVKLNPKKRSAHYSDDVMDRFIAQIEEQIQDSENTGTELPRSLLIVDDMGGDAAFAQNMRTSLMKKALLHRHFGLSIIFLVQSFTLLPKKLRMNLPYYMLFKMEPREVQAIAKEIAGSTGEDKFRALFARATDTPHGFLYIDRRKLPYRYFASFTREITPATD